MIDFDKDEIWWAACSAQCSRPYTLDKVPKKLDSFIYFRPYGIFSVGHGYHQLAARFITKHHYGVEMVLDWWLGTTEGTAFLSSVDDAVCAYTGKLNEKEIAFLQRYTGHAIEWI